MLNRLDIENYRILRDFHIEKVGQVNLIVGRNNAGKSTVLEAIRVLAGNARREILEDIANSHDERFRASETDEVLPLQGFFSRQAKSEVSGDIILIGDHRSSDDYLTIENVRLREYQETIKEGDEAPRVVIRRRRIESDEILKPDEIIRQALAVTKNHKTYNLIIDSSHRSSRLLDNLPPQQCSVVPTRFLQMEDLATAWDSIVFTESENFINEAVRYIAPAFDGLTFVDSDDLRTDRVYRARPYSRETRRYPIVKMRDTRGSHPLRSLGDGVLRAFQLAIKSIEAKGGFLLIDEFENGLHYSVQQDIWRFVFKVAAEFGIQVFATTHSWDCVQSFAQTAMGDKDIEGVLIRVGTSVRASDRGNVIATSFSETDLSRITQTDLEVR